MSTKSYLAVSGVIFFLVGMIHLGRLVYHWRVQIGAWTVPGWLSYCGAAAGLGLSLWAHRLRGK